MKKYEKTLFCLTALLICSTMGSFISCAEEETVETTESIDTTKAVETDETDEKDRLTELGEKDFDGRVFMILDANDHPDMHVNMPGDVENGDIINDALYRRNKAIEDMYHIGIQYHQTTSASTGIGVLKNSVLAEDNEYQLCISTLMGGALATAANDGILANLCDVPYLSLDENWWSSLMYNNLRLNDKMYYTAGDVSPVMYQMAGCLYVNLKLAEDYDINENFPQLVRDGKWTFDIVEKITKNMDCDLNSDGKMDSQDDFAGFDDAYLMTMFVGAGIDCSTISDDGKTITVDFVNEYTFNVIEKINKFYVEINSSSFNDKITKMFMEDRALILNHLVESAIVYLRDMESDYLILPIPKYDEEQEDYRSYCNPWASAFIGVPRTADAEYVGFVTEALGYYSYKNVRHQTYDLMLKQKVARDEDNIEMLDCIFNNLYLDFNSVYNFGGSTSILESAAKGNADLASSFAKIESKVKADINNFIENWNGIEE